MSTTNIRTTRTAITILDKLTKKNYVPIYTQIKIAFVLTMVVCAGLQLTVSNLPPLSWDNAKAEGNPLSDFINLYELYFCNIRSNANLLDVYFYYKSQALLNVSRIDDYYGNITYKESISLIFS